MKIEKAADLNEIVRTHGVAAVQRAFDTAPRNSLEADRALQQVESGARSIGGRSLVSVTASDLEPQDTEWLWKGRLARGEHTMLAGEPATGKSQLSIAIVAALTTGDLWPCGEGQAPRGSAIILSAEDHIEKTLVPRLIAAGADRSRVRIVKATYHSDRKGNQIFNLQEDLDLLQELINSIGDVLLVYIDPVTAYMGGGFDSHKNTEVRRVLQPVGELAQRANVAVLSVTHFAKGGAGNDTKALHKVIGSVAFTAAPRMAFMVTPDPDNPDRNLFLHLKNNIHSPPQGLAYRIGQCLVGDKKNIISSSVMWDNQPVSVSADEAIAASGGDRSLIDQAMDFLRDELRNGEVEVDVINSQAKKAGIAPRTLTRARSKLQAVVRREGFGAGGKFFLSLPDHHRRPTLQ